MMRKPLARLGVGIVVALMAGAAQAVPITFAFSGEVTSIIDNSHVLGNDVAVGDIFDGTYTFDSTLTDSYADPSVGLYFSNDAVMQVSIGVFDLIRDSSGLIRVENGPPGSSSDSLSLSSSNFTSSGLRVSGMVAVFRDSSATMFADDSLPLHSPSMSTISAAGFQIEGHREFNDPIGFAINGVIHELTPEPGALFLITAGVLGLTRRRGR
jgi:hypothetical protein